MLIVGVGFKKNRGKDTICKFLKDNLHRERPDLKVKVAGFADKLKDVAFQLYGWAGLQRGIYYEAHYDLKEVILPLLGKSPRDIWIELGNKCREIHPNTWIDNLLKSDHKCDLLLVKDMGFVNEASAIYASEGLLLKVNRPNQPMALDARETELDLWQNWSHVFENSGTLHDLNSQVVEFCDVFIH